MKIQEVMKLQRKALGITQQDLADMSEIAISTIKKIESDKGNPSLSDDSAVSVPHVAL